MTEERLSPIARDVAPSTPTGRPADLVAFGLASLAVLLALSAALWFFFGFAENDTRLSRNLRGPLTKTGRHLRI